MNKQLSELTDTEISQFILDYTINRGIISNNLNILIGEVIRRQSAEKTPPPTDIKLPQLKKIVSPTS